MTRTEEWVAFGTLALTIIGAVFWLGSNMATESDVDAVRRAMDENMREIRTYIVDHLDGHPTDDN